MLIIFSSFSSPLRSFDCSWPKRILLTLKDSSSLSRIWNSCYSYAWFLNFESYVEHALEILETCFVCYATFLFELEQLTKRKPWAMSTNTYFWPTTADGIWRGTMYPNRNWTILPKTLAWTASTSWSTTISHLSCLPRCFTPHKSVVNIISSATSNCWPGMLRIARLRVQFTSNRNTSLDTFLRHE